MDYYKLKINKIQNNERINLNNEELVSNLIALIWVESELQSVNPDKYVFKAINLEEVVDLIFKYKNEILNRMK